jgi:hypothetical protein
MSEPSPEAPNDDAGRAAKAAAIIGGALTLAALALYGTRSAFSVMVGASIAVANLVTMRAIIRALLPPPEPEATNDGPPVSGSRESAEGGTWNGAQSGGTQDEDARQDEASAEARAKNDRGAGDHAETGRLGGVAWGIFAAFKILILFGGIWFLLTRKLVDPMPLVVGYGVLPLGIAASALWSSLAERR